MKVYTPGVWDLLHIGHVRFLERASAFGSLIVGVPGDKVVQHDKGSPPIITLNDRMEMLSALYCVSEVHPYYRLEFLTHLNQFLPDVVCIGEQFGGAKRHDDLYDWCNQHSAKLIRIPYTSQENSTAIKARCHYQISSAHADTFHRPGAQSCPPSLSQKTGG